MTPLFTAVGVVVVWVTAAFVLVYVGNKIRSWEQYDKIRYWRQYRRWKQSHVLWARYWEYEGARREIFASPAMIPLMWCSRWGMLIPKPIPLGESRK